MKLLVGGIDGKNVDIGVAEFGTTVDIVHSERRKIEDFERFSNLLNSFLKDIKEEKDIEVGRAAFAVAGSFEGEVAGISGTDLKVDRNEILENTLLSEVVLVNNFDAAGLGVNTLIRSDVEVVQEAEQREKQDIAVVAADKGLKMNKLAWNQDLGNYVPDSSGGDQAEFEAKKKIDLELENYLKQKESISVNYEDLVSGKGLENIYSFLQQKRYPDMESNLSAGQIIRTKENNPCSKESFDIFIRFYGRCCKKFLLEARALGGLYISGGIAAENPDEFDQRFLKEFRDAPSKFEELLSSLPVKIITDPELNLRGAAKAFEVEKQRTQ